MATARRGAPGAPRWASSRSACRRKPAAAPHCPTSPPLAAAPTGSLTAARPNTAMTAAGAPYSAAMTLITPPAGRQRTACRIFLPQPGTETARHGVLSNQNPPRCRTRFQPCAAGLFHVLPQPWPQVWPLSGPLQRPRAHGPAHRSCATILRPAEPRRPLPLFGIACRQVFTFRTRQQSPTQEPACPLPSHPHPSFF